MGQRVLVAIPELYAQALNARGRRVATIAPEPGAPTLPPPAELDGTVTVELALLDRMPVGLAIHDAAGRLVHANPCFDRLVGGREVPSRACPPTRWSGQGTDGGALAVRDFPCERAMRGETVSPGVDLFRHDGTGAGRRLNVSAAPIVDPATGAIIGLVLLYLDTQDRAETDRFAAEAASRFEQFAEQSSAAIWIADAQGDRFSYRNPRHLFLAGGTRIHPDGVDSWLERIEEADRAEVRRRYALVRSGRTERMHYSVRHGVGGSQRIDETCFPIFDDAGHVVSIAGLATAATEEPATILYLVGAAAGAASPLHGLERGGRCKVFASLDQLIAVAAFLSPGCVVVDLGGVVDPDRLDEALIEIAGAMPVIAIGTAETAVATAVDAMRRGAADYLIAPVAPDLLAGAIRRATGRLATPAVAAPTGEAGRLARLSTREREVLAGLVGGGTNKSIARDLAISPRTVELYRARLMERMNAGSLAELLRAARDLGGS